METFTLPLCSSFAAPGRRLLTPSSRFRRNLYSHRLRSASTEVVESAQWKESSSLIVSIGLERTEADTILSQAFGWGSQKYWHKKKVNEDPSPIQVKENIDYLQSVGFTNQDLIVLMKGFPEILGCDLNSRIQPSMEYLEKNYFLKGPHRVKAILRKPKILGNIVDCEGDCKGECSRCWSQF